MDNKSTPNPPDISGRGKGKGAASIDDEIQNHLGRQLQSIYDDVLHQPVPERFMSLLRELDEAAQKNAQQPVQGQQSSSGQSSQGAVRETPVQGGLSQTGAGEDA